MTAIDKDVLVAAATMLSDVFAAPPSEQRVAASIEPSAQKALRRLGAQLSASGAAERVCHILGQKTPDLVAVDLQRNYTRLFEGIFRHQAVPPYESNWCDARADQAVLTMNATLRALNLRVSSDCCEPVDHLSIQLSAFAEALLDKRPEIAFGLSHNMTHWVPAFCAALELRDATGFYAENSNLLIAFLRTANDFSSGLTYQKLSLGESRSGELT